MQMNKINNKFTLTKEYSQQKVLIKNNHLFLKIIYIIM